MHLSGSHSHYGLGLKGVSTLPERTLVKTVSTDTLPGKLIHRRIVRISGGEERKGEEERKRREKRKGEEKREE